MRVVLSIIGSILLNTMVSCVSRSTEPATVAQVPIEEEYCAKVVKLNGTLNAGHYNSENKEIV